MNENSYPPELNPTQYEVIVLPSGNKIEIPKTHPTFNPRLGNFPVDNYGRKPVLDFNGKKDFAELIILKLFLNKGWNGVWVDTFSHKYRTSFWPKNEVKLPLEPNQIIDNIYKNTGSRYGCWDVFCWKDNQYLFAEAKRSQHDRIRDTQKKFLEAAINFGLPKTSFLIVEWVINSFKE
jgi:hypothetical protein